MTASFDDGTRFEARRDGARLVLSRDHAADTVSPFPERTLGELLAEELRRLDADQTYGNALGAVSDMSGLNDRPAKREHIWNDPALAGADAGLMAAQPDRGRRRKRPRRTRGRRWPTGSSRRWPRPSPSAVTRRWP